MINKVQMFQIAGEKINNQLVHRKLSPVFQLRINEAKMDSNHGRREKEIDNSRHDEENFWNDLGVLTLLI